MSAPGEGNYNSLGLIARLIAPLAVRVGYGHRLDAEAEGQKGTVAGGMTPDGHKVTGVGQID